MKNVWKRTMSLVLSGVLLLGSVPVQALAAEEIVEEVVEEIVLETEPKATQPQQTKPAAEEKAAVSAKNVKKVKGTGSNPLIDYPIAVNGVQVSSDKADNILGDADKTVSFVHSKDKKENKLTLNNAEVESVEWASHSDGCGPDLIIYLPEGTESTIGTFEPMEFEGAVPGNVRITGEGKLNIEDIEVSGNLVIENAVVNITGNAHLILAAEKEMEADTDNADNTGTLAGKGVYRTSDGGSFTLVTEETALPADGEYLEFVSDSHLGEDCFPMEDNAAHYRTCASDTCPLRDDVKIVQEHGSETEYVKTASTHQLVYSCCGAAKELAAEHTFAYVIAEDKTSMTQVCNLCGQTGEAIAVTAPVGTADGEVEWDGGAKEVTVNDSAAQITYYKADDLTNALAAAPDAPGSYVAVVMTNGQELRMAFKIRQKALTDTAITVVLSYDSAVYDGEPKELPGSPRVR